MDISSHHDTAMGANQSMHLDNRDWSSEEGYVCVDSDDTVEKRQVGEGLKSRKPEEVSIPTVLDWEETLFKDPKNRYQGPVPIIPDPN